MMRRILSVVLSAVVLSVGVSAVAAASPGATAPICHTADLRLGILRTDGAAGSEYIIWGLKNASAHTCSMKGYPGVSAVNVNNHLVHSPATRTLLPTPHLIVLASGHTAHFLTRGSDVPQGSCTNPEAGAKMRIFIPNGGVALYVRGSFSTCALQVSSVYLPTP
jgi:hypothetical protein